MSWCNAKSIGSFTTVSSEELSKRCKEVIEETKKWREKHDKETREQERRRIYIFWGRKETDEEIDQRLKSSRYTCYPTWAGYETIEVAEQLLRLCKRNKRVFLTREDASTIDF